MVLPVTLLLKNFLKSQNSFNTEHYTIPGNVTGVINKNVKSKQECTIHIKKMLTFVKIFIKYKCEDTLPVNNK